MKYDKLSAFADEIGDDPDVQIEHLKANGVNNIELRGVWGKNVLDLSPEEIGEVEKRAKANGLGFSAIGSPLGKFPLSGRFEDQLEDLKKALDYASAIEAPYIRMFSFYIPEGEDPANCRSQVLDWLGKMAAEAENTDVVLAHENEKGIYGDTGGRCLDLYENINSKSFTGVFDFANYVQCSQKPYEDCWISLRDHISYFHVKDAAASQGNVVPAGEGDGDIARILTEAFRSGFDNFLTLEPHLSVAAASYGKTTPALFKTACKALRKVLDGISV
ncbi:MAG: sugar phosphate isomerase/epimerase family protein [Kiritimatiellia bacterium]